MNRLQRLNRPEAWLAIAAFALYLLGTFTVVNISGQNPSAYITVIVGLAEFMRTSSQFLGGFCIVVFATPHLKAHEYQHSQRIAIYALRIVGAVAFILV